VSKITFQWKVFLFAADKHRDLHFLADMPMTRSSCFSHSQRLCLEHKLIKNYCWKQGASGGLMVYVLFRAVVGHSWSTVEW